MSDLNIGVLDTYPTAAELFDLRSLAAQLYAAPIDELEIEANTFAIIDSPNSDLFVARTTSIVGQLVCTTVIETGVRYGLIGGVVVDESSRNQGIARKLTQTAIEQKQLDAIARFDLTSSRPDAQALYASIGFSPVKTTVMRYR